MTAGQHRPGLGRNIAQLSAHLITVCDNSRSDLSTLGNFHCIILIILVEIKTSHKTCPALSSSLCINHRY